MKCHLSYSFSGFLSWFISSGGENEKWRIRKNEKNFSTKKDGKVSKRRLKLTL